MIGSTTPPLQDRIFQAGNGRWRRMARWQERVVIDPAVLRGKPVVRGTRIAVGFVVELLAAGWPEARILEQHPQLTQEDARACLAYAAEALRAEEVHPIPAA
jgi:uncharacterized protein (DUF433 family)